jgi:hypothetical protein
VFNTPYLFCLYAEDVRQEMTGQMSIIGVFQGGLRIPSVPAQLPKLAIIANLRMPSDKAPNSVKLEVHRDGEVLQTIDPPSEFFQTITQLPDQGLEEGYTMQFIVGFSGLPSLSVILCSRHKIILPRRKYADEEEVSRSGSACYPQRTH